MNSERGDTRIPEAFKGIQINYCKNPRCVNFGVHASTEARPRGIKVKEGSRYTYTVCGSGGHIGHTSLIRCDLWNERPPLKSNKAIGKEISRMSEYLITFRQ